MGKFRFHQGAQLAQVGWFGPTPVLRPLYEPRSKYMPHQGNQERYRRRMGGWAKLWRDAMITKNSAFHGDMHGVYHGR